MVVGEGGGGGVLREALFPHDLGKEGKNIYKKMKATVNSLQARISL